MRTMSESEEAHEPKEYVQQLDKGTGSGVKRKAPDRWARSRAKAAA